MAVFNPQVQPINDPNWTSVSRPISDISADKSKAIAISGAAEVLDSSVKAADTLTKQSIKTDVDQGVDTLRDAYTDSLKTLRNAQIAASQPSSLLPDGGEGGGDAPPPGLQNGIDRVKQIGTALAQNSSKINDTLYTGALTSLAKQLRSSYPGYRDYIDEQIKSVSGIDPANAFMSNLLQDINRNSEANKTATNAALSTLRSNADAGFHDKNGVSAANVMTLVNQGIWTPDKAMTWLNSAKSLDYDLKKKADARKDRQEDEADDSKTAVVSAGDTATRIINQGWSTLKMGKNTETFAGMTKFLEQHAGDQNITDEQARQYGAQMQALRNNMYRAAWAEVTKAGYLSKGGENSDAIKKALDTRFAPMDMAIQAVFNKDWGSAYSHMNFNEAISSDSVNVLNNADDDAVRKYNRMSLAIGKTSPQAAAQFFQSAVLGGVPKKEAEFLKNVKLELLTQPDADKGDTASAQGAIDKMKQRGLTSPKTYNDFVDTVNYLSDPKWSLENRINLARGFFDPVKNAGLLSDKNFRKDEYVNGQYKPGKTYVFTKLSSPTVANSIAEISKSRPDIGKDYETMMSREFGEQLFSRELRDLGTANAELSNSSGYKIAYVSDKGQVPRFSIRRNDGTEMTMTEALAVRAPVASVNRLNTGISGLYNVYSSVGSKDPSVDILNTMYKYGYQDAKTGNLDKGWSGDATDVPRMIWNSLVSSQQDRLRKAGEAMRNK